MDVLETCIYATDLEAARTFYEDMVGLECFVFVPDRHAFFYAGHGVFLIFNPDATEQEKTLPPHGARGSIHVCFRVDEDKLDDLKSQFINAGYETSDAIWANGQSFYVYDPSGNLVEFAPAKIWGLS